MSEYRHIDDVLPPKASVIQYDSEIEYPALSIGAAIAARMTTADLMILLANYPSDTELSTILTNYYDKGEVEALIISGGGTAATAENYQANDPNLILDTDAVWTAAELETVDLGAACDFATFINGQQTLTGNISVVSPSNGKIGQTGIIRLVQDGTGGRTASWHANWLFPGGTDPVLSTAAGAVDILSYFCLSATTVYAALAKDVK